jgi:hypothetical protein
MTVLRAECSGQQAEEGEEVTVAGVLAGAVRTMSQGGGHSPTGRQPQASGTGTPSHRGSGVRRWLHY